MPEQEVAASTVSGPPSSGASRPRTPAFDFTDFYPLLELGRLLGMFSLALLNIYDLNFVELVPQTKSSSLQTVAA